VGRGVEGKPRTTKRAQVVREKPKIRTILVIKLCDSIFLGNEKKIICNSRLRLDLKIINKKM
jgi:hypothetical protein